MRPWTTVARIAQPGWFDVLVVVALALIARAAYGNIPLDANDVSWNLVWGESLIEGRLPDYEAFGATTPHPLHIVLAAAGGLFGDDAAISFMQALGFLSHGALIWGVFRLGQAAFSTPVGTVAAVLVGTNHSSLGNGTVDSLFVPLVLLAGWLEVSRPRRGAAVLVVLALAGLLRPDAWPLAAAYALYLAPGLDARGRLRVVALAASAPVLWMLSDLAVTGRPLWSLLYTRDLAAGLGRATGLGSVPYELLDGLRTQLRPVGYLGGAIGMGLCLYLRRARAALVPLSLVGGGVVMFTATGVAGLPLNDRYLRLTAVALTLFAAFAAIGWLTEHESRVQRPWQVAGALLVLAFVALTPAEIDAFRTDANQREQGRQGRDELRTLMASTVAGGLIERCGPLHVIDSRMVALVAYYSNEPAGRVRIAEQRPPTSGLLVVPTDRGPTREFAGGGQFERARAWAARAGVHTVAAVPSWRVLASDCGS